MTFSTINTSNKVNEQNATADWQPVGSEVFRRIRLYDKVDDGLFGEDIDWREYGIAAAELGGAVAVYERRGKKCSGIGIYSCSGKLVEFIQWDGGTIAGVGWSEAEELTVVSERGCVRRYSDFHATFSTFSLGESVERANVVACRFWHTGFVALTGDNTFVSINYQWDGHVSKYYGSESINLNDKIYSWNIIPPKFDWETRNVNIIVAINNCVRIISQSDSMLLCEKGPVGNISVSPSQNYIALYGIKGILWIVKRDTCDIIREYNTGSEILPGTLCWCSDQGVVIGWEDEILLIGRIDGFTRFYYDNWIQITEDLGGVRVYSNESSEFIECVPDVCRNVFSENSGSPSAMLLEVIELMLNKSLKADENILNMDPDSLRQAVDECIQAAGREFNVHWQKKLLKAASTGKTVLEGYDSEPFVKMCQVIRVINGVRSHDVALGITYDQYVHLGEDRLIKRLLNRSEHLLALRIAEYLGLGISEIYMHWACERVRSCWEKDDNEVCGMIVERLNGMRNVSFERVARSAFLEGRMALAVKLLHYEVCPARQVDLFVRMNEEEAALDKAIESGNTDLVGFVVIKLREKLAKSSFFRILMSRPIAMGVFERQTIETGELDALKDFYYQTDRRLDGAGILFSESLNTGMVKPGSEINSSLQLKRDKLKAVKKYLEGSRDGIFMAQRVAESDELAILIDELKTEYGNREFENVSSVYDAIFKLLSLGMWKRGEAVAKKFNVGKRLYGWIELKVAVSCRMWSKLEGIANEKGKKHGGVIGWKDYFDELYAAGNKELASKFIVKCEEVTSKERIQMWVDCGNFVEAAREIYKERNVEALRAFRRRIESQAGSESLVEIDHFIDLIKSSKSTL